MSSLSRRSLLAIATQLATTTAVKAARPENIIVIGAGIAGLAAAQVLQKAAHHVTVLESRDRIGGRIWTSKNWSDVPVDLGASWIHGIEDNPITALADQANIARLPTFYDRAATFDATAREVDIEAEMSKIEKRVERARRKTLSGEQDQSLRTTLEKYGKIEELSPYDKMIFDHFINSTIEQEYGGDWSALSTWDFDSSEEFDGADVLFPKGYGQVIDVLAEGLRIKLNSVVSMVSYDENGVTVKVGNALFKADRVVCTLPLGVLKKGSVAFIPPLPSSHLDAISGLGMGVLNKVYLKFAKPFWPSDLDWLERLTPDRGQFVEWLSLQRSLGQPILLGFNAGEFGGAIESRSDKDIVASAMAALRLMFGGAAPDPIDFQITRWASDPYAYGSYSFNATGTGPKTRNALARNLGTQLYFAGEATSPNYPGTVHGAYLSGLKAASDILA